MESTSRTSITTAKRNLGKYRNEVIACSQFTVTDIRPAFGRVKKAKVSFRHKLGEYTDNGEPFRLEYEYNLASTEHAPHPHLLNAFGLMVPYLSLFSGYQNNLVALIEYLEQVQEEMTCVSFDPAEPPEEYLRLFGRMACMGIEISEGFQEPVVKLIGLKSVFPGKIIEMKTPGIELWDEALVVPDRIWDNFEMDYNCLIAEIHRFLEGSKFLGIEALGRQLRFDFETKALTQGVNG